jgi:hypothetical protein
MKAKPTNDSAQKEMFLVVSAGLVFLGIPLVQLREKIDRAGFMY